MDLSGFLKYQNNNYLSVYNDSEYGLYIPSRGLIVINTELEKYNQGLTIFSDYSKIEGYLKGHYLWVSSVFHEMMHCYQLLGSTTGYLEALFSSIQLKMIESFLFSFAKSNQENIFSYRNYIFNGQKNHPIIYFGSYAKLRCLFGYSADFKKTYSKYYLPKISDFENELLSFANTFLQTFRNKGLNIKKILQDFQKDLSLNSLRPVDYIVEDYPLTNDYCYNHKEHALHISPRAIIEGYARFEEMMKIDHAFTYSYLKKDKYSDKIKKLIRDIMFGAGIDLGKEKIKGIYSSVLNLLSYKLSDFIDDYKDLFKTIHSIFKLTLMTRLSPASAFIDESKPLKLEEIIITYRFQKLLEFFIERQCSVSSIGDQNLNEFERLDFICDQLGWVRYTDSLKGLNDLYCNRLLIYDPYINQVGKEITQQRMGGRFIKNVDGTFVPAVLIFNDNIRSAATPAHNYPDDALKLAILDFQKNIFLDLISNDILYRGDLHNSLSFLDQCQHTDIDLENFKESPLNYDSLKSYYSNNRADNKEEYTLDIEKILRWVNQHTSSI